MVTFIRIPKSGSTSLIASISQIYPNIMHLHHTVEELKKNGATEFFTMVRNPLQQYVSTYYYVRDLLKQNVDFTDTANFFINPFIDHVNVINQTNGLEEYLLNAPQNSFLGKYLSGISVYDLVSVGVLEDMDTSRMLFNKMLGLPIVPVWLKRNPMNQDKYIVEDSIATRFKNINELEYELYHYALNHFQELKNRYL